MITKNITHSSIFHHSFVLSSLIEHKNKHTMYLYCAFRFYTVIITCTIYIILSITCINIETYQPWPVQHDELPETPYKPGTG